MKRPLCYICAAFVVTVFIYLKFHPLPDTLAAEPEGSRITFLGEVYQKEYKNDTLILYLKHVKKWNSQQNTIETESYEKDTGIMCYMKQMEAADEPRLGSLAAVTGEVSAFTESRNPGGFDAKLYYKILGLDFRLYDTELAAQSSTYSKYRESLYQIRRYLEGIFDAVLPENDASVMKAIVLGNRSGMNADSRRLYQQSGISHIFAISGLHISLIGMGLYRLLRKIRVPAIGAAVLSVLIMIAYGDMVGMSSSAYRAIFMFGMKMLAGMLRRTYDMLSAVALAAVLLLIDQPLYLYHSGFLLSFGAILGIGCMFEVIKPVRDKPLGKAGESLCASLSIFLIHFPIMLCVYYEFPIYSFLLNLIIIPAMTVMMGLGLLCLACGSIPIALLGLGMAKLLAFGCHLLIVFFEGLCRISLMLPGSDWIVGKPNSWRVYCFYIVVLFLYAVHQYTKRINKSDRCAAANIRLQLPSGYKMLLIITAVSLISSRNINGFGMTFVDVGQGDCIWLETPAGHHYLIDSGSTSKTDIGQYTLVPFLKYTGTSRLDAVFLTHLDQDHISGVMELLENTAGKSGIELGKIVIAEAAIRDEAYWNLVDICAQNKIPLEYAAAGDVIDSGDGLRMTVLHPEADYQAASRNAYSLAVKLDYTDRYGTFGALLTGDIEADGEAALAEYLVNKNWSCQLYKAAHHGSRYSNTEALLEEIRPQISVISCGEKNSYGHPHQEVLERLASVGSRTLVTKDTGAILVRVRRGAMQITQWIGY